MLSYAFFLYCPKIVAQISFFLCVFCHFAKQIASCQAFCAIILLFLYIAACICSRIVRMMEGVQLCTIGLIFMLCLYFFDAKSCFCCDFLLHLPSFICKMYRQSQTHDCRKRCVKIGKRTLNYKQRKRCLTTESTHII